MPKLIPLEGQTFGRLLVTQRALQTQRGKVRWHCVCECGTEVVVSGDHLRNEHTQSCGCYRTARQKEAPVRHGDAPRGSVSRLYRAWQNMKARCYNPNHTYYSYYGARGIEVCDKWRDDYPAFARDMGEPPSPQHSLDRVDPDGGYTPDNTRWADKRTQSVNRRNAIMVTFKGETHPLPHWCERYGLPLKRTRYLLQSGRTPEQIFGREADAES